MADLTRTDGLRSQGWEDCETCGGDGILEPPISGNDPHGAFANTPCPDCNGTGQVPEPDTVEAKARELHDSECVPECSWPLNETWRRYARGSLLAYTREAKEKP